MAVSPARQFLISVDRQKAQVLVLLISVGRQKAQVRVLLISVGRQKAQIPGVSVHLYEIQAGQGTFIPSACLIQFTYTLPLHSYHFKRLILDQLLGVTS